MWGDVQKDTETGHHVTASLSHHDSSDGLEDLEDLLGLVDTAGGLFLLWCSVCVVALPLIMSSCRPPHCGIHMCRTDIPQNILYDIPLISG